METPEDDRDRLPAKEILKNLNTIRDSLVRINAKKGTVASFSSMRREIEEVGWNGIIRKYHPDMHVDDPAAMALFDLYRFVYSTMDHHD